MSPTGKFLEHMKSLEEKIVHSLGSEKTPWTDEETIKLIDFKYYYGNRYR